MSDLAGFRAAVREQRRTVGRTQQQLARNIGLHPNVLSHKLNGSDGSWLTAADIVAMATALAGWGAMRSRAEMLALLEIMDVPPQAVPKARWDKPPLSTLEADEPQVARGSRFPSSGAASPLPFPPTPLIGRRRELAAGAAALDSARLVTLTGPGGTGKTRLAIALARQVADRFPDGVVFADLAAVLDSALLGANLVRAIGLEGDRGTSAETRLVDALRGLHVLLLVDNVEQLLQEAPLLARLLAAAPQLTVLATSRIPLRLSGEHELRVPPLTLPPATAPADSGQRDDELRRSEAVELFVQRARDRGAEPRSGGELEAVAAICAQLDGLPLAIELAASRTQVLSFPDLNRRLTDRLGLLTTGARDLPQRQQTLRATLDWSFGLLARRGQELLTAVGVFVGSFDLPAAGAVSGIPADALLDDLGGLVEHSLLELERDTQPRFRMLQTVREYALGRLAESGREAMIRDRHLDHFLRFGLDVQRLAHGPEQVLWLDRLEAAGPDIRAALEWCQTSATADGGHLDDAMRLATAVGYLWRRAGSLSEGARYFDQLLDLATRWSTVTRHTRAAGLVEAGLLACFRGDYDRARHLTGDGVRLAHSIGDQDVVARGYRVLAETALSADDADAEQVCRRSVLEADRCAAPLPRAEAYNMLGWALRRNGKLAEATDVLRRGIACARATGSPELIADMFLVLASVARGTGDLIRAIRLCRGALRRLGPLGFKRTTANGLEELARSIALAGDVRQSLVYLGAAGALRADMGSAVPTSEDGSLTDLMALAVLQLSPGERRAALAEGRNAHLMDVLAVAVRDATDRVSTQSVAYDPRWSLISRSVRGG